jgi:16S rRNA (adenine1518-N6/adenine1519-N6)-dimethyltransferase
MNEPKPNKNLGQHWLHDPDVLEDICDEAQVSDGDVVFEIGPGLGTLTRRLVQRAKKVIALEFDQQLAAQLNQQKPAHTLTVMQGDILRFDLGTLPKDYKVVANLPYYITSKIVRLLLESSNPPKLATLLVQKEVAERMAAQPGDMSILAVAVQFYSEAALGPVVPAELFTPPPKVDSQVITLKRRPAPLFPDVDAKLFFRMVRAGFGEKRKKLRNSLSGGLHLDKSAVEKALDQAGIPAEARAEELAMEQWHQLVKIYGTQL